MRRSETADPRRRAARRLSLLAVGPLPPPLDGPSVSFELFCDEIAEKRPGDRLAVVDTSPRRLKGDADPVTRADVWRAMRIVLQVVWHLPGSDRLVVFGSNGFLARMAPLLVRLARLARRPCYLRPFGGSLDRFCESLPERRRNRLLRALAGCRGVVVQTRLLQTGLTDLLERTVQCVRGYRVGPQGRARDADTIGSRPELRLLFLGHVREEKGIFTLIESLGRLAGGSEAVHCDIYGPVYDRDAARFEQALDGTAAVTYRGVLPRPLVSTVFGDYDALVFPTCYPGEGHPGVVIEAMQAGLPIITTRFRSLPELVDDGVNGLLVPVRDPSALADAIRALSRDRERLRRMAERSKVRGREFEARIVLPELCAALGLESASFEQPTVGPLTYLRTARHLRPVQITSRFSNLVRRRALQRSTLLQSRYLPPRLGPELPAPLPLPPPTTLAEVGKIGEGVFTFLGQTAELGRPVRWVPRDRDTLFLYQLHAFEYLLPLGARFHEEPGAADCEIFRGLVNEWLEDSPVASSPSWDPYPTSLRIRNWLHAYSLFAPALRNDESFTRRWLGSLYSQTLYLEAFLERHLLGNHLIENARALLLAGLFFQDGRARRWRRRGEQILWRELDLQFLDDGGHYERSPMYHQIMLELYREVAEVLIALDRPVPARLPARLQAMEGWLAAMLHPDGDISLFNDTVLGMARRAAETVPTAEVDDGLRALPESGYFVFRNARRGDLAIFDCGVLGPDHQPGHGHCDCLSFELSVSGRRMIVDSGVGTYYGDASWRHYYRTTRAHNTIQVDGAEQSAIWDRFRVADRAKPAGVRWSSDEGVDWVSGAHTGYSRLPGGVVHRRWFCWIDRRFWLVVDRLTGQGKHRLESFLHFHPDSEVSDPVSEGDLFVGGVERPGATLRALAWGAREVTTVRGATSPIQGWYAPRFNCPHANPVWAFRRESELPVWMACVLFPGTEPISGTFSDSEGPSLRAEIKVGVRHYRVSCDGEDFEATLK